MGMYEYILNQENRLHVSRIFYKLYFKRYGCLKIVNICDFTIFSKLRFVINIDSISEIWQSSSRNSLHMRWFGEGHGLWPPHLRSRGGGQAPSSFVSIECVDDVLNGKRRCLKLVLNTFANLGGVSTPIFWIYGKDERVSHPHLKIKV